jgi:hypothetical protein
VLGHRISQELDATRQRRAVAKTFAWEALPSPKRQFLLHIVRRDMTVETFSIERAS